MFTTLLRIVKYGTQNFLRNGLLSTATIVIMVFALLVVGSLIIFNVGIDNAINAIKDQIDISVYFKDDVGEKDILAIQKALEEEPHVARVEYVSKDQALSLFKERHESDPIIAQALQELNENPLAASLSIKAKDQKDFPQIVEFITKNDQWQADVSKISYTETQLIIDRLTQIFDSIQTIGWTVTIFLIFTAVVVTFNTISLTIYSNREEIGIMRLVGGSNYFIRSPYLVTGVIYGLIAGMVSFLFLWFYVWLNSVPSNSYTAFQLLGELRIPAYFHSNFFKILSYQIFFGVLLGIASSVIAVSRYLRT